MRFRFTDDYDVGEFDTYPEAVAAHVRRNPARYAQVRKSELPVKVAPPPPPPLTPSGYDHYMAVVLGTGMYERLANMSAPLPQVITVSCYDPAVKASDPTAQRVTLLPKERTAMPSGLATGGAIVDVKCVGRFLGESKAHYITVTLFTGYNTKVAIVRDDIHTRSHRRA